ncbi:MAG: electron transport complex subunit RsxG [Thiothrix nivea]|nr:MAG: electron transport complex subunit RsxG [Thiothrix nivea]
MRRLNLWQNDLLREIIKPALYLFAFALSGTLVLALIHSATAKQIRENERLALLRQINLLVAPEHYNNDPLADRVTLAADTMNSAEPVTVYRARQDQQPVAAIYVTTSPDGYSGKVRMVVGINADQSLAGVRVISHQETPGLGDRIDAAKDDWILEFTGKSLQNPSLDGWAVKKDGGQFDQFTGATITARAVVNAVRATLLWSQAHQAHLYAMPVETSDETGEASATEAHHE